MMPESRTLSLMAIQHELGMAIGLDLRLEPMVLRFLDACVRRLTLRAVHLYLDRIYCDSDCAPIPHDYCRYRSIPARIQKPPEKLPAIVEFLGRLRGVSGHLPALRHEQNGDTHYLIYPLKGLGALIMERLHDPLGEDVAAALVPVVNRFRASCRASMGHEEVLREVSRRQKAEAYIAHSSLHDELTELPNRRMLLQRLSQHLARAERDGQFGALLFVDVDHFKRVNDSLGHAAGDNLLRMLARRLANEARSQDTIARFGSDEFVLLLPALDSQLATATAMADAIAQRLRDEIAEPYRIQGRNLHISASIGLVIFPDAKQETAEDLLRHADVAMYSAKRHGRPAIRRYHSEMDARLGHRLDLEAGLRDALRSGGLWLSYQPQVDADGHCIGAEALLRWQHPQLGLVSPASFIPVAEESGLILPIGDWVLEHACELLCRLAPDLHETWTLAINLSARQLRQPDIVERVDTILERTGADPARLELEITESMLITQAEETVARIRALKARGIRFSLDDFGTGYSSLAYLRDLPLDRIKIDQSFVRDLHNRPENAAIIEAILAIAHHLGMSVIAEGVETAAEQQHLLRLGCRHYQGYLYGKPDSEAALQARLDPAAAFRPAP